MRKISRRRGGRESPMKKDEKTRKPLHTAAQILDLYRQLSPEQKREFKALVKELSSTTPEGTSADQVSAAQQGS